MTVSNYITEYETELAEEIAELEMERVYIKTNSGTYDTSKRPSQFNDWFCFARVGGGRMQWECADGTISDAAPTVGLAPHARRPSEREQRLKYANDQRAWRTVLKYKIC